MSTRKHTPGPWAVCYGNAAEMHIRPEKTNGGSIAGLDYPAARLEAYAPLAKVHIEGDDQIGHNAHRIVACVNACTGIEDPTGTIPALVKALRIAEVALMPTEDGAGDKEAWAVVREALAQVRRE